MELLEQKEYIEKSLFAGDYDLISTMFTALQNLERSMQGSPKKNEYWFSEYKRVKQLAEEKLKGWEGLAENYYLPQGKSA